ncbi:MAG: primosomal protein N' [Bacteroidia bacterium]|nr:primosomal protein N' [Bacteroidia bacterium]
MNSFQNMPPTLFADVILPLSVPNLFTYSVPGHLAEGVKPGQRALVPFGKHKIYSAVIRRLHDQSNVEEVKEIISLVDEEPVVNDRQFQLWDWISEYYMCFTGEVLHAALPASMKMQSETRVILHPDYSADTILEPTEQIIAEMLHESGEMSVDAISKALQKRNIMGILRKMMEEKILLISEEVHDRYRPKYEIRYRLSATYMNEKKLEVLFLQLEQDKRKHRQVEMLMLFLKHLYASKERVYVRRQDIMTSKSFSASALDTLLKNGILEEFRVRTDRVSFAQDSLSELFSLNSAQQEALDTIRRIHSEKEVCLLHGVTSSGKTELYMHLIREQLKMGKQVLYLLPEIALTTQIINRLGKHFGDSTGVYHSRYSDNERTEIWNHVLSFNNSEAINKSQIILGARSALFLPFSDLGLIIVDEEHDSSYKQTDPAPRYNARDSAIVLGRIHGARVLLGSATPSMESFHNATSGRYGLVFLKERFGGMMMPEIIISDVAEAARKKQMKTHFSPVLVHAIRDALDLKEQVILFQNRRGFSPYLQCNVCQWIPHCKNCSVTLTYHKQGNQLKCHYCAYAMDVPRECAQCGHHYLEVIGFGTEKIEEEISLLFPKVRVARLDHDATKTRNSLQQILNGFEERQIDILVGTQMVSKGLDFDNVSTVGIVNADQLINFPDFRAHERGFQLMSQVSGRSGRKKKRGKVIIQTRQPGHWVIQDVVNHDYNSFYDRELKERSRFGYPPLSRLTEIVLKHKEQDLVEEASRDLASRLKEELGDRVSGPFVPVVSRIRQFYHRQLLIKVEKEASTDAVRNRIRKSLKAFYSGSTFAKVLVHIDADPV